MSDRIRGIDFGTSTSLAAERTNILDPVTNNPLGKTTNWMPTLLNGDPIMRLKIIGIKKTDRINNFVN